MSATATNVAAGPPVIRQVPVDRPWAWLAAGWRDILAAPAVSLTYGGLFAVLGWILAWAAFSVGRFWLILPATSGFLLVAPMLAVGLYECSRLREQGQSPTLAAAFGAWRRNAGQIGVMGVALLLLNLFWVQIAGLLFMLFFGVGFSGPVEDIPAAMLRHPALLPFLVVGTLAGFALAATTFMLAAFAIPMLLDRDIGAVEAMIASMQAVRLNLPAMLLWAVLIVGFTAGGLATLFVGLIVVLPLVGHASWHAYRDLFR